MKFVISVDVRIDKRYHDVFNEIVNKVSVPFEICSILLKPVTFIFGI